MKPNLLVLGSVNSDFTISTAKFPQQGQTITGQDFTMTLGGKGANQAFYTDQFGIPTTMICSVGQDYFGQFVLEQLGKTSITLKPHRSTKSTGKAFVFVSEADNRIILDPAANYDFDWPEISAELKLIKPTYLLSQLEIPLPIILKSFIQAHQQNVITVLNPAPANIDNNEIYGLTDYLILNETEANELSGLVVELDNLDNYAKVCQYFLDLGVKHVVLTIGAHGSFYKSATEQIFVPALKINPVNTTGAGDSYLGAFLAKIMNQESVQIAMEFATRIAGQVAMNYATQVHLKQN